MGIIGTMVGAFARERPKETKQNDAPTLKVFLSAYGGEDVSIPSKKDFKMDSPVTVGNGNRNRLDIVCDEVPEYHGEFYLNGKDLHYRSREEYLLARNGEEMTGTLDQLLQINDCVIIQKDHKGVVIRIYKVK